MALITLATLCDHPSCFQRFVTGNHHQLPPHSGSALSNLLSVPFAYAVFHTDRMQRPPQAQAFKHSSPVGGTLGEVMESLGGLVLLEKHITMSGL